MNIVTGVQLLALIFLPAAVAPFGQCAEISADETLSRAMRFADMYNWHEAAPLFARAEQLFRNGRNPRNTLYAHLGVLREAQSPAIAARSREIDRLLSGSKLLQTDKLLRLFALSVKGELDGEIDSNAARADWTSVTTLARELNLPKWIYRAQGQIGFADYYDGDLASCQRDVASALIAATKAGDVGAEVFFLSATANGFFFQGMQQQAIDYAARAIAIAKKNPGVGYPDIAYDVLANSILDVGKLGEAKQLLADAFHMADSPVTKGEAFFLASRIAETEGQNSRAISLLESGIKLISAYGENRVALGWESKLSKLYMAQGNLLKAEELAQQSVSSIEQRRPTTVIPEYLNRLNNLAQVLIKRGKFLEADGVYRRASVIEDAMIGKADTLILKTAMIAGASNFYAEHFALIAEHFHNPAEAYRIIEEARGRAIADLLAAGKANSARAIQIENEISRLRLELTSAHSDNELRQIRDAIFLAEQTRAINPGGTILNTKALQPVDIRTLQTSLTQSNVIVEYVLSEPRSYCLVITRTTSRIVPLAGKNIIETQVSDYVNLIKAGRAAPGKAAGLYKLLLGGVDEYRDKHRLTIIPDGKLHLLPFDSLLDDSRKYVVESKTVLYAPSSTSFYLLKKVRNGRSKTDGLLALGAVPYGNDVLRKDAVTRGYTESHWDLPASGPEVVEVAAELRNSTNTLLMNEEATETAFKKAAARPYRFIHLAVHAFPDDDPDRAALILLSDPRHGDDGFLQASEIVQMHLASDLVVLSACDTGVGPIEGEEGKSTLSTAFLLAGAHNVVSTLWPIEDESALFLMTSFYRQLAQHLSPADSLAEAKREMLKTFGSEIPPVHWAGFVIEGADSFSTQPAS